jgi:predicted O-linked N-acetylglucosamine transferase (SPINDLY family)
LNVDDLIRQASEAVDAGQFQAAVAAYHHLLAVDPQNPLAYNNLGLLYKRQRRFLEAQGCLESAARRMPESAEIAHNLGDVYYAQQRLEEAVREYRRALELRPGQMITMNNLALALSGLGRHDESLAWLRLASQRWPNQPELLYNLGNAQRDAGDWEEAIAAYQRVSELTSSIPEAQSNCGLVLLGLGRVSEAIAAFTRAITAKPGDANAHRQLGIALHQQGRWEDALTAYQTALHRSPQLADAHYNLGLWYHDRGQYAASISALENAYRLEPEVYAAVLANERQYACRWEDLDELCRQVLSSLDSQWLERQVVGGPSRSTCVSPFIVLTLACPTTAGQQQIAARLCSESLRPWRLRAYRHPAVSVREPRRLRVGYLSADFHEHATAWLMRDFFACHQRQRFEIFGYSYGPDDGSLLRRQVARGMEHFRDISQWDHATAAAGIIADQIDILVDLKGYTQHARPEILALRPAPLQVHYLGYPGTLGADFIDYMIVDSYLVPANQQAYFDEELIYLPGCYQANGWLSASLVSLEEIQSIRHRLGLPSQAFVYAALHSTYKITSVIFDIWMRLLAKHSDSYLWLLDANAEATQQLQREAERRGVNPARLIFLPKVGHAAHLQRLAAADLFLDTFPVNAHTTASDALQAGVPVISLSGETLISRVAGSLLTELGLPELIVANYDDYERLASELAIDRRRLEGLKEKLRLALGTSHLFKPEYLVAAMEQAYEHIWRNYQAGLPPQSFMVTT